LAECSVISVTRGLGLLQLVHVAHEAHAVEEASERRLGLGVRVVLGGGDELLEVLQRASVSGRAPAQRVAVAGLLEHEIDERRRRQVASLPGQPPDRRGETLQRAPRLPRMSVGGSAARRQHGRV
jgi:hypothetical protein